ncbi:MAG: DEAD/DEAH box helicase [Candidatus Uhrbacteria bacterium]|nr:DEAD/DEAH box helicase [Candidatus Uhrbacteria bacterium]
MSLFDEDILREISHSESFRRGKRYVSHVEKVRISRTPNGPLSIKGNVYGTRRYEVSLFIAADGSRVEKYHCSCPYDFGGACKHVVALGLVALRRSVIPDDDQLDEVLDVLRDFAKKNGTPLTEAQLQDLAKRLHHLPIQQGLKPHVEPPHVTEHSLDRIELAFSYQQKSDLIHVSTAAVYGPFVYDLEGFQLRQGEELMGERADRNWEEEHEAMSALRACGFREDPTQRGFILPAEHALHFIENDLQDLAERYVVLADDAFDALSRVHESTVTTDFDIREGKQDWLAFSVDWKCGDRELTPQEISDLAAGWKKHIRRSDGSFVHVTNQSSIARLQEVIGNEEASRGRMSRMRAIELALLCEGDASVRLANTVESVTTFLRDAKTGTLMEKPKIPLALRKILRPYQCDAVAWILFLRRYQFGGVLADDMGLGKTLQALAAIVTERPKGALPSLVVCPKTLIPVWLAESKRFTPSLKVSAVEGNAKERESLLKRQTKKCGLLVTSYSLLQRDAKLYRNYKFYYAILDEAQYVKNPKSLTAAAVRTIQSHHRLALTGTPLENGVHELWSLFDFLMPGLLGDRASFRSKFELPIRVHGRTDALVSLKRRVKPFMLRRTKEMVAPELPPRIEQTDVCPLTEPQASLYADVLSRVREDVYEAVQSKGFKRSQIVILSALTKLRQVCNHPALVDKRSSRESEVSGKMAYALELVREAVEGGHKVLLFSQFTSMLDLLRDALDKMKISHLTIEGKTQDRATVVKNFRDANGGMVFLLSLRAAGTGLTLTEADTVILYDPWWNPMVERQAMDRAHRIGQTKTVNVHKLATRGTIEERVLALQEKKKSVFDAIVSETAEGMKGLSWEDVQGLFE